MNYLKITTAALALTMTFALGNNANAQMMAKKEKTVMVGGAPVSYTHLDVYKRQALLHLPLLHTELPEK